MNYKTGKHNIVGENSIFNENFANELECITITYDVS